MKERSNVGNNSSRRSKRIEREKKTRTNDVSTNYDKVETTRKKSKRPAMFGSHANRTFKHY